MLIKLNSIFGFNDAKITDFLKSQWQHNAKSINYVIYRWFVASIFIASLIISMTENPSERNLKDWLIYLTRWGLVLNLFTNILAAILVTLYNYNVLYQNKINAAQQVPIIIQIYGIFQSVTVTLALLITIVYWGCVHVYGTDIDVTNIANHIVNSVILMMDMFVIRHQHKISHMIYVGILIILFLIFSFVYYKSGGLGLEYADWGNFKKTFGRAIVVLIAIALLHIFVYAIYILRVWIYEKQQKKLYQSSTPYPSVFACDLRNI